MTSEALLVDVSRDWATGVQPKMRVTLI
jgi:hypothetical protein